MTTVTLYHGTLAELAPGDLITPAGAAAYGHRDHLSPGWVFATEHMRLAQQYGNGQPGGVTAPGYVYEVEALGPLEQDPADVDGSFRSRQPLRVVRLAARRPTYRDMRFASGGWMPLMNKPWETVP